MNITALITRLREGTHGTDTTKTDAYLDSIMARAGDQLEAMLETMKEMRAALAAAEADNRRLVAVVAARNAEICELRARLKEIVQYANLYGIRDEGDGYALVRIAKQALEGPSRAG